MSECKTCPKCQNDDSDICPVCGFCGWCHEDSSIEGSCASFLATQKTEYFKFHAHEPVPTYECGKCGGYKFIVGKTNNYETSIKCERCGFEKVVHEG